MSLVHRLILSPSESTRQMLIRRMRLSENTVINLNWGAVLLIQGPVVEIFEAVDIGTKAANVAAYEIIGSCPQHINTVGFIGGVADVEQVVQAVEWTRREVTA